MTQRGLFVGLVTLDIIYLADAPPQRNQKIVALDYALAAGGPATNAAVTFGHLGNQAVLLGLVGIHPLSQLILADLKLAGVAIADLNPSYSEPLPTSSIIVTQGTGERAVVSLNAVKTQVGSDRIPQDILYEIQVVLIDGHQMTVGQTIAQQAKSTRIPVVVDAGSWKPGFEHLLPWTDYVICSANFHPPGCSTEAEVFAYLSDLGVSHIAITNGAQPIRYRCNGDGGEIPTPCIQAVDTLGAGDIFHGAFCHYIQQSSFESALIQAASIASFSCQFFGTRRWISEG